MAGKEAARAVERLLQAAASILALESTSSTAVKGMSPRPQSDDRRSRRRGRPGLRLHSGAAGRTPREGAVSQGRHTHFRPGSSGAGHADCTRSRYGDEGGVDTRRRRLDLASEVRTARVAIVTNALVYGWELCRGHTKTIGTVGASLIGTKRTSGCGCSVAVDAGVTPTPVEVAMAISQSSIVGMSAPIVGRGGLGHRSRVVVPVTELTISVSPARSLSETLARRQAHVSPAPPPSDARCRRPSSASTDR